VTLTGQERFEDTMKDLAVPVCSDFPSLIYQRPMNKLSPQEAKKDEATSKDKANAKEDNNKRTYRLMKSDEARPDFVAEAKAVLGFGTQNIKAEDIYVPADYRGHRWRDVLTDDIIKVINNRFPFENV